MSAVKSVIGASFVGGTILFIVAMIFHFGAYQSGLIKHFETPQKITDAMKMNAPESGVYVLSVKGGQEIPLVLLSIDWKGKPSMILGWVKSWATSIFITFIATLLLLYYPVPMTYFRRLGLLVLMGLLLAIASHAISPVQEYASLHFTLYSMIAIFVSWFCASLAIAKIVKH